jgi:hypothetical protein
MHHLLELWRWSSLRIQNLQAIGFVELFTILKGGYHVWVARENWDFGRCFRRNL